MSIRGGVEVVRQDNTSINVAFGLPTMEPCFSETWRSILLAGMLCGFATGGKRAVGKSTMGASMSTDFGRPILGLREGLDSGEDLGLDNGNNRIQFVFGHERKKQRYDSRALSLCP